MICEMKKELLTAYQETTRKYSEAVAELNKYIGTSTKSEYDALYRMTEALRVDAAEAKLDLENHVEEHLC